jgi:hypothetical protein
MKERATMYHLKKLMALNNIAMMLEVDIEEIISTYPDEEFIGRLNQKMIRDSRKLFSEELAEILNKVCDLPFLRDKRTPVEYGYDLIYGWLMEDIAIKFLEREGLEVERTGADATRVFLKERQISSFSDIKIKDKYFDITFDTTDSWWGTNSLDIRLSKWNELRSVGGGIICFSQAGVTVIDVSKEEDTGVWLNPAWGFKEAVSIGNMRSKVMSPNLVTHFTLLRDFL